MIKKTIKNALITASLLATSQVVHSAEMTDQKIYHFKQTNLEDVYKTVQDLINNKDVPGKKIIVISDLDGTLTSKGHPSILQAVKPRGCSQDFINFCFKHKINTVVSSAWDIFAETLFRVKKLGISDILLTTEADPIYEALLDTLRRSIAQANQDKAIFLNQHPTTEEVNSFLRDQFINTENKIKESFTNDQIKQKFEIHIGLKKTFYNPNNPLDSIAIEYCHVGNVVSIRDTNHDNFTPQFYRNKALAPLIVYPNLDYLEIDHVIFIDDSSVNVEVFLEDMKRLQEMKIIPFKDTMKMKIFELSEACGQDNLK